MGLADLFRTRRNQHPSNNLHAPGESSPVNQATAEIHATPGPIETQLDRAAIAPPGAAELEDPPSNPSRPKREQLTKRRNNKKSLDTQPPTV